jgi:hypothetical protein
MIVRDRTIRQSALAQSACFRISLTWSGNLARRLYRPTSDTLQELDLLPVSSAPAGAAVQSRPTAPICQ